MASELVLNLISAHELLGAVGAARPLPGKFEFVSPFLPRDLKDFQ
jgi:hypothetical protein